MSSAANPQSGVLIRKKRTGLAGLLHDMWRARISYFMLLFFFVPFFVFGIYPIANSAYFSVTDYTGSPTEPVNFLGLENFRELLSIEIVDLPRLVDEATGELIYQCGRRKYPEREIAEADRRWEGMRSRFRQRTGCGERRLSGMARNHRQ